MIGSARQAGQVIAGKHLQPVPYPFGGKLGNQIQGISVGKGQCGGKLKAKQERVGNASSANAFKDKRLSRKVTG